MGQLLGSSETEIRFDEIMRIKEFGASQKYYPKARNYYFCKSKNPLWISFKLSKIGSDVGFS